MLIFSTICPSQGLNLFRVTGRRVSPDAITCVTFSDFKKMSTEPRKVKYFAGKKLLILQHDLNGRAVAADAQGLAVKSAPERHFLLQRLIVYRLDHVAGLDA